MASFGTQAVTIQNNGAALATQQVLGPPPKGTSSNLLVDAVNVTMTNNTTQITTVAPAAGQKLRVMGWSFNYSAAVVNAATVQDSGGAIIGAFRTDVAGSTYTASFLPVGIPVNGSFLKLVGETANAVNVRGHVYYYDI